MSGVVYGFAGRVDVAGIHRSGERPRSAFVGRGVTGGLMEAGRGIGRATGGAGLGLRGVLGMPGGEREKKAKRPSVHDLMKS